MTPEQRMSAILDFGVLGSIAPPWLHLIVGERSLPDELAWVLVENLSLSARVLRGRRMGTVEALFAEFAAAFQFPYYFGENWAAFDECIKDMDWFPSRGYVPLVSDAAALLAREDDSQLRVFLRVVSTAVETYAQPIARGEAWDRPALPFHLVLHEVPGNTPPLIARFAQLGHSLHTLNRP